MLILLGYDQHRPEWGLPFREAVQFLQVSPDTDSLISNGYHNNLKMSQSCDFLPIKQPKFSSG